ncbi:hypothetical protein [Streptomyces sp. NBC_01500]|uniref:hypothetical protein n=1 Tax=Streptomyces sp. NBC_01500 TaxID=2903886 RepID=UPI00225AEA21|nr:hypothetical protein [Streptomyces sp. NBC_01500]MCX4554109.1 hypothetical protein [Streptomyces sp. NBC_01500]
MSESEIDWVPLIEIAGKVACEIADKWSVVEADDVKQEILTHLMTEKHILSRYTDDEALLRKVCWNAGKRYAAKERNHFDLMDDQYYYTPEEVRVALRSFTYTDDEIGQLMGKEDDLTRCRISDNILTARTDASKAIPKLNDRHQEALQRVFIYGIPARDQSEERAAYRAVDTLAKIMNRNARTGR